MDWWMGGWKDEWVGGWVGVDGGECMHGWGHAWGEGD